MQSKNNILLIEDDNNFRDLVADFIKEHGYQVVTACDGEQAKDVLKNTAVDLIISDVKMPEVNGLEFLEWVRNVYDRSFKNDTEIPVVLITGFKNSTETKKATDMGVKACLTKPFKTKELIAAVNQAIQGEDLKQEDIPQQLENNTPKFCRVSLEDFVADREIEMDVYVKITDDKFVKIANQGGKIDLNRIENYRKKGLEHLFIESQHFRKIIDFNIMLSKVVSQSDEISIEKKKRFMANTADIILENTVVNGIDEKAYNDAKDFFTTSFDVLTDDEETFSILEMLAAHGDHLYAHCLGVSIYSVLIARNMDWRSTANLFKLSFGALMHDIGKKEFPSELIDKPRTKLTYDERKLLETHSFRSKEILETLKSAPQEVVEIAFQHHENILGQGFPRQISKNRIHPMAKIVSVADNFCNYAMKGPNTPGVNAKKAIHLIDTYKQDQLDPDCIKALKASVK